METASMIASIVSIILGGISIWLAVMFYRMSDVASREIKGASNQIDSSIKRLESLFDKLYSDTFSMMRETVTDMRQHIWRAPQSVPSPEQIDRKFKEELERQVNQVVERQTLNETQIVKLRSDLSKAIELAVKESTPNNPALTSFQSNVLHTVERLLKIESHVSPEQLKNQFPTVREGNNAVVALFQLRKLGLVSWDGPESEISDSNKIVLAAK